jgi:hypothetical protein
MNNQNYLATPAEVKPSAEKKTWLIPDLEIIGTDEIEGGHIPGPEGAGTPVSSFS